jgi:hypothetical protein
MAKENIQRYRQDQQGMITAYNGPWLKIEDVQENPKKYQRWDKNQYGMKVSTNGGWISWFDYQKNNY